MGEYAEVTERMYEENGRNIMRSFTTCNRGDQIKESRICDTYSTHMRDGMIHI